MALVRNQRFMLLLCPIISLIQMAQEMWAAYPDSGIQYVTWYLVSLLQNTQWGQ